MGVPLTSLGKELIITPIMVFEYPLSCSV